MNAPPIPLRTLAHWLLPRGRRPHRAVQLGAWQRLGGTFVLRIEDTDEARNRPEWTDGIIDALAWIGISSTDPAFEGPYFQSQYADQHVAAAETCSRRATRTTAT